MKSCKDLVKRLRSYSELVIEPLRNVLTEAADVIEGLENAVMCYAEDLHAYDWIPVTVRLPESGQSCLCYYNGGQWGQLSWINLDRYINSEGCSGFYPFCEDAIRGTVTHWMPLPPPPEGEE